jgi:hypothetical protein
VQTPKDRTKLYWRPLLVGDGVVVGHVRALDGFVSRVNGLVAGTGRGLVTWDIPDELCSASLS